MDALVKAGVELDHAYSYMFCSPTRSSLQSGRLPVDRLLTHRLKLDEINLGFDRLASGEAIRQIIDFD